MKFCYADESCDDRAEKVQVMVGIVADAQRLNRSRSEFSEIFALVEEQYPEALKELKGSRIFYGRGGWREVPPEIRKAVFRLFCEWIAGRKHALAVSAIDIEAFRTRLPANYPGPLRDLWVAGAVHIALQLQKLHQTLKKNKGHTVLIFDENKQMADRLNEVLFTPPAWTEAYYEKGKKQAPLDQIIDSAFFTKSHHAGLVQVADLFAFVLRRYAELADYGAEPEFVGEMDDLAPLVGLLAPRLISRSCRCPKRPKDECAETFVGLTPTCLVNL
jgi:hypothetical protein